MSTSDKTMEPIEIQNPKAFQRACTKALSRVIDDASLLFKERKGSDQTIVTYQLVGNAQTPAYAYGTYITIPFFTSRLGEQYWLAIVIETSINHGSQWLDDISIVVFNGFAVDDLKSPILRAEWACTPRDYRSKHAQPHWHLYPSKAIELANQETELISLMPEAVNDNVVEFGATLPTVREVQQPVQYAKMHFAMSTNWHLEELGDQPQSAVPSLSTLPTWLAKCVDYIREELQYVNK